MTFVPRDRQALNPRLTALVVFDMLEAYRPEIEAARSIEPVVRLAAACRARGAAVAFARADHRADGADLARCQTDTDRWSTPWTQDHPPSTVPPHASGSRGLQVLRELAPQPGDYDVPKHRWSAFHGTHLELSLRSRGVDTILLVGGSTHVGVASTAYAGRDLDFQVVVVPDGCHGIAEQRDFFLRTVFPRMCRVRPVAEVLEMFDRAPGLA